MSRDYSSMQLIEPSKTVVPPEGTVERFEQLYGNAAELDAMTAIQMNSEHRIDMPGTDMDICLWQGMGGLGQSTAPIYQKGQLPNMRTDYENRDVDSPLFSDMSQMLMPQDDTDMMVLGSLGQSSGVGTLPVDEHGLLDFGALEQLFESEYSQSWFQGPSEAETLDLLTEMDADQRLQWLIEHDLHPTLIPRRFEVLVDTSIPLDARESLSRLEADVHNPYELGEGKYNFDEYSVILEQLPAGMTPEDFLNVFLKSPNAAADSALFDAINVFHARNEFQVDGDMSAMEVGDWYHIDMAGPNNGDVMMVDKTLGEESWSATVQTMTDSEMLPMSENHPVSGRRQFGLEQLEDGGYRFYTRGFDRATNFTTDNDLGRGIQDKDWTTLVQAVAEKYGGKSDMIDEYGNPVWGWRESFTAEELLDSGVLPPSGMPCSDSERSPQAPVFSDDLLQDFQPVR